MSQLITLRSGLEANTGRLSQLRESLKLSMRAFLNRQATYGWLQLLNSHPLFRELVKSNPRLMSKIYRPYLSNTFNCGQRLALLQDHYRFILKHGLGTLVMHAARGPVLLGTLEGKSGLRYQLQLRAVFPLEREGELVLQLQQDGQLVYSAGFVFFHSEQGLALGIGCMQGPQGDDGLQRIKDATRELHGLRPKNLMVRLLRQLGYEYGCRRLHLVGNANRTVHAARRGKVFADYDTLWQEMDAQRRTDGDYQLPCEPLQAPVMADIASKKRSEMRKRHELLETAIATVRTALQARRMDAFSLCPPTHDVTPAHDFTLAPPEALDSCQRAA